MLTLIQHQLQFQKSRLIKHHRLNFLCFLAIWLLSFGNMIGQSVNTLRILKGLPQGLPYELGRIPKFRTSIGAPYISNMNIGLQSKGMTLGNVGLSNGTPFYDLDFSEIEGTVDPSNDLHMGLNVDLLHVGYRYRRTFFSFHIGERIDFNAGIPRAMFGLLGDVERGPQALANQQYDLGDFNQRGAHYRFFGFGVRTAINEYVSIGAKVKYLKGLKFIHTNNQGLNIFGISDNPMLGVQGTMDVFASGLDILSDSEGLTFWDYLQGSSLGNNGIAFDFGANLKFNENFEVFGSILDWGSISWESKVNKFSINDQSVQLDGTDLESFKSSFNDVVDNLFFNDQQVDTIITTDLVMQSFFGGYYHMSPDLTIGLTGNTRLFEEDLEIYSTLSVSSNINNYLSVAGNATYGKGSFQLGAGLVFNAGPLQMYAATDNVLGFINIDETRQIQATGGINLLFGKPKPKRRKKGKTVEQREKERAKARKRKERKEERKAKARFVRNDLPEKKKTGTEAIKDEDINPQPRPLQTNTPTTANTAVQIDAEDPEINALVREDVPDPILEEDYVENEAEEEDLIGNSNNLLTNNFDYDEDLELLLTLKGKAVDAESNEHLTGIAVEFYRLESNGSRSILLLHGFYNGNITLHPNRYYTHLLVVSKQGYEPGEFWVKPNDMKGLTELTKRFVLKPL